MPLQLEIVTPEHLTFSDQVDLVVAPGVEGELGVLPAHVPLVTTLQPGELRYIKDGHEHVLAVGQGILEITRTSVSVLTDMAIREAEIDEEAVEEALRRAREAMEEKLGGEELATVEAAIQKSLAQLHVKRRRRRL